MLSNEPILQMQGISKCFAGVQALRSVDFTAHSGEVVALIGENGAGKSTLMKILSGIHPPDAGSIRIAGKEVLIRDVSEAINLGIGFIHQEMSALDNFDIAGNVFLGREPLWCGPMKLVNSKKLYSLARPYLKLLGLELEPSTLMSKLSIAQQQIVEIAKALSLKARILIMDEPTSSLTLFETKQLFEVIHGLRTQGVCIIYISHRLAEVKQCADRVVVLKDGTNAGFLSAEQVDRDNMVRLMVGRDLKDFSAEAATTVEPGYFRVEKLRTTAFCEHEVSFEAAKGEILSFAGLVGAGRSEMARAIFGVDVALSGKIYLDGKHLRITLAKDAISNGIYLVPEDRKNLGLVTEMNVRENITLPDLWRYASGGLIRKKREAKTTARQCQLLKLEAYSKETEVKNLSGGNQQKVVLSKWLAMEPKVIIFDEPTRGIDMGAKSDIYKLMRNLADNDVIVIMISSDMEEILNVSDRIAVMHQGQITGILKREEFNEETVMRLAVGQKITAV